MGKMDKNMKDNSDKIQMAKIYIHIQQINICIY